MTTYKTNKAFEVAEIVIGRRNIEFTEEDTQILEHVFEESKQWRRGQVKVTRFVDSVQLKVNIVPVLYPVTL